MRTILARLAVALTVAAAGSVGAGGQLQTTKPVKVDSYGTFFRAPAETLAETILAADAVVRGRIVGSAPHDVKDTIVTAYRLTVIEVLHTAGGRVVNSSEIDVLRRIGERDRGPYIERRIQQGFPAFDLGHEYVVYLTWNQSLNGWVPAFGPDSVMDITSGGVESPGNARLTAEHKGRSAEDYLDLVRGFGRK